METLRQLQQILLNRQTPPLSPRVIPAATSTPAPTQTIPLVKQVRFSPSTPNATKSTRASHTKHPNTQPAPALRVQKATQYAPALRVSIATPCAPALRVQQDTQWTQVTTKRRSKSKSKRQPQPVTQKPTRRSPRASPRTNTQACRFITSLYLIL